MSQVTGAKSAGKRHAGGVSCWTQERIGRLRACGDAKTNENCTIITNERLLRRKPPIAVLSVPIGCSLIVSIVGGSSLPPGMVRYLLCRPKFCGLHHIFCRLLLPCCLFFRSFCTRVLVCRCIQISVETRFIVFVYGWESPYGGDHHIEDTNSQQCLSCITFSH